ncbi:MAG: ketopantoate reductase C-terminal domain-containing protein [Oscillospiraceae bacterium]
MDGLIWKKAFINLTINPLTALFDRPIGMVEQCEEAWALGRQEIAEAVQVANASGQSFSYEEVCDFVWQVLHGAREGTTSMRTDIRAGRPTEIAYLNGAVAALRQAVRHPHAVQHHDDAADPHAGVYQPPQLTGRRHAAGDGSCRTSRSF